MSAAEACCAALEGELEQQEVQRAQHAELADPAVPLAGQHVEGEASSASFVAAESARDVAEQAAAADQHAQQAVRDAQYQLGLLRYKVEERRTELVQYQALAGGLGGGQPHHHGGSAAGGLADGSDASTSEAARLGGTVCDRCLQPIDGELFSQNVARMQVSGACCRPLRCAALCSKC